MLENLAFISSNLARIRERIEHAAGRARRHADEITIVAVSKMFGAEAIRAAYDAGLRHFGENRVQEFEAKRAKLDGLEATWHFIGRLQSNKVRRAVHLFDRIDCIDSVALAKRLESSAAAEAKRLPVLIEVHLGGEATKGGAAETDLPALAADVASFSHLELHGLMTIPPYFDNPEQARPFFRKLRELRDDLENRTGCPLPTLSMGMSHDFVIAIEEGATEIRVGTALFGDR